MDDNTPYKQDESNLDEIDTAEKFDDFTNAMCMALNRSIISEPLKSISKRSKNPHSCNISPKIDKYQNKKIYDSPPVNYKFHIQNLNELEQKSQAIENPSNIDETIFELTDINSKDNTKAAPVPKLLTHEFNKKKWNHNVQVEPSKLGLPINLILKAVKAGRKDTL